MVYVNIPYVAENDRLDPEVVGKELGILSISEDSKHEAFAAIYHKRPRGVNFTNLNEALLLENEVEIVVQINGKMRARLKIATDASEETVQAVALGVPKVAAAIAGKGIRKVVIVPNKLVNIVTD